MSEELIAGIANGSGSTVLRVDDVVTVAIELSDELEADLVEGEDEFRECVAERRRRLAERVSAHAALELLARAEGAGQPELHVVTTVATMRSLLARIDAATRLVEASRDDARARAGAASGLAVHPTAIRDAAADVIDARAGVAAAQADVERLATAPDGAGAAVRDGGEHSEIAGAEHGDQGDDPTDPPPSTGERSGWRSFIDREAIDREETRQAAAVVGISVVVGIVAIVVTGSAVALVGPGFAVCWAVVLVVRQRDDAYDEEIASRNLANVSRMADRAYGGAGLPAVEEAQPSELMSATRALSDASDRLAFAEASWRALVGLNADVDDVESVVRARDAQYGVNEAVVAELPSVRAAAAHGRRLRAQWKLAWWALDRPVPWGKAANRALDALEGRGITEVSVPSHVVGGLSADEQQRLVELADGRSRDDLRAIASRVFPLVIVADTDGSIDDGRFREETALLPDDVRFVLVAPTD